MKKAMLFILTLTGSLMAASASAATYNYNKTNGVLSGSAAHGTYDSIDSSYSTNTNMLSWTITNGKINGSGAGNVDGFWLVLNDGPNPKSSDVNELAIMYADFNSNKLLAYAYNGQNNANSIINPGILIKDYSADIINDGMGTIGFNIDVSFINDFSHGSIIPADWKGMQYDEKIGVWFHVSTGTNLGQGFTYTAQRWYDTANQNTTVVPVPAALFLFAPALVGFAAMRRKLATK